MKIVDVKLKVEQEPGQDTMDIELDVAVDPDPENPDQEPLHTQVTAQVTDSSLCCFHGVTCNVLRAVADTLLPGDGEGDGDGGPG